MAKKKPTEPHVTYEPSAPTTNPPAEPAKPSEAHRFTMSFTSTCVPLGVKVVTEIVNDIYRARVNRIVDDQIVKRSLGEVVMSPPVQAEHDAVKAVLIANGLMSEGDFEDIGKSETTMYVAK